MARTVLVRSRFPSLPPLPDVAPRAVRALGLRLARAPLPAARFRCAHALAGHVVDFFCEAAQLAVEVARAPSASCEDAAAARRRRDLRALGIELLRVDRHRVLRRPDDVLAYIHARVIDRLEDG